MENNTVTMRYTHLYLNIMFYSLRIQKNLRLITQTFTLKPFFHLKIILILHSNNQL